MIIKTIIKIVKLTLLACLIILILGYPIIVYETNPFTYYYSEIIKLGEGIKQIMGFI